MYNTCYDVQFLQRVISAANHRDPAVSLSCSRASPRPSIIYLDLDRVQGTGGSGVNMIERVHRFGMRPGGRLRSNNFNLSRGVTWQVKCSVRRTPIRCDISYICQIYVAHTVARWYRSAPSPASKIVTGPQVSPALQQLSLGHVKRQPRGLCVSSGDALAAYWISTQAKRCVQATFETGPANRLSGSLRQPGPTVRTVRLRLRGSVRLFFPGACMRA